jgi:hypothetical protein
MVRRPSHHPTYVQDGALSLRHQERSMTVITLRSSRIPNLISPPYNPYDVMVTRVNTPSISESIDDTKPKTKGSEGGHWEMYLRQRGILRRLFRSSLGPAGALNVYAIEKIGGDTVAAFSQPVSFKVQIDGTQARQIADSIFCESRWLTDPTKDTQVLPHECGHILGQVGHSQPIRTIATR